MNRSIDVALILWNQDVIHLMSVVLLDRNLMSCGLEPSEGLEKIEDLIISSRPSVVVFDLDPPYQRSAAVAQDLLCGFPDVSFVMTCADPVLALKKAPWLSTYPMFQKPYDIPEIVNTLGSLVRVASVDRINAAIGASRHLHRFGVARETLYQAVAADR